MPALAWEGRQGAEAALGSRGTTVPLSVVQKLFPSGSEQATKTICAQKLETNAYNQKYQQAYLLSLYGKPLLSRFQVCPSFGGLMFVCLQPQVSEWCTVVQVTMMEALMHNSANE